MKRSTALIIVAPMALVVSTFLLLMLLLDEEKLLELATGMLKEQTGATLVVKGKVGLKLFPGVGVSLEDATLAMPDEEEPAIRARSLQIGLQLLPLLSGQVAIERLELAGLDYRVAADPEAEKVDTSKLSDAELDAYYAQRRGEQARASEAVGALAIPLALNVATLKLTDSRLEVEGTDGSAPTIIELRRFSASDLNLEARPISLAADIYLPGEQPVELDIEAAVRVDQASQAVSIERLALVANGATADPVSLQAHGDVDLNRQTAELQLSMDLGDTRGEGSLVYAARESPAIDADMHFNRFDPAVLVLAGPDAASVEDGPGSGDEPLPLATLRDIDTRAALTIDEAVLGGHPVQALQLQLRALEGVVEVQSLTGEIYDGQLAAQASFNGQHNTAILETSGTVQDLDIAAALAGAGKKPLATGKASLDWKLHGAGRSRNDLVNALAGPLTLQTSQVVLQGIGVERMLCEAVALTNKEALSARFPPDTRFQALGANIQLADGRASLQPLRAELAHIKLTGTGAYTLLAGDFDATFKARLSPELESLDRACRVSKRLTAIDWPLDCKGNINGPPGKWCQVDTAEIVKDLSVNEAQRKIEKKAGKLLEKLFN